MNQMQTDIIYKLLDLFGTYTVYKFMHIFYKPEQSRKRAEWFGYGLYFLILTVVHRFMNIPVIMMICNLLLLFAMTYHYKTTLKSRLISSFLIYFVLIGVETIVVLLSGYVQESIFERSMYSSVFGLVSVKIITFAVVLCFGQYRNLKEGYTLPNIYWFCIVIIPITSLFILLQLLQVREISVNVIILSILLMLITNASVFYLYDAIMKHEKERTKTLLLKQEHENFLRQFDFMELSIRNIREIKHDLKNHVYALKSLVDLDLKQDLLNYLDKMMETAAADHKNIDSGNITIDSMLNLKLFEAEKNRIVIRSKISIPDSILVSAFDITIILGNLLDNAIEAADKLYEADRRIDVTMKYDKGRLLIRIANRFDGTVIYDENKPDKLVSTKPEKKQHGLGLENVKKAVEAYNGTVDISVRDGLFEVFVMMYC